MRSRAITLALVGLALALGLSALLAGCQGLSGGQAGAPGGNSEEGWTVLFRSSNPRYWGLRANHQEAYAVPLTDTPSGTRFVRLRRMDTREYVILPIRAAQIAELSRAGNDYQWSGGFAPVGLAFRAPAIAARDLRTQEHGVPAITIEGGVAYTGWGFAAPAWSDDHQSYCWRGQSINPTAFEVAVASRDLHVDEQARLLQDRNARQ